MSEPDAPPVVEEEEKREPLQVIEVPGLVFDLIEASMANTHSARNALISSLEKTIVDLRGEIRAIREGVAPMCSGPYAPNPKWIEASLWPSRKLIERYAPPGPYITDWDVS